MSNRPTGKSSIKPLPRFKRVSASDLPDHEIPGNCGFCGKSHSEARQLIVGPGGHICYDCILLCCAIMYDNDHPDENLLNIFRQKGKQLTPAELDEKLMSVKAEDPAAYFKLLGYVKGFTKGLYHSGYLTIDGDIPDIPA